MKSAKPDLEARIKLLESIVDRLFAQNKELRAGKVDEFMAQRDEALQQVAACREEHDDLRRMLSKAHFRIQELNLEVERAKRRRTKKKIDDSPPLPAPNKEMWRRLVQLCHPDRHENSVAANAATAWLMKVRP